MNNVEKFLSEVFGEVRAIKEGEAIWFCASDVAEVLEYSAASDMTRGLDKEDKDMQTLHTPGGSQKMLMINESGLYSAVLSITKRNPTRYKRQENLKDGLLAQLYPL